MPTASGGNATYLPKIAAGLIVNYSRNPKDFLVNELVKLSPVDRQIGRFPKLRAQEAARLLDEDYRRWSDGGNRPVSDFNKDQWSFVSYETTRWEEAIPLGYLGMDQADFPVLEAQQQSLASRGMLFRAKKFYALLETTAIYPTGHNDTATNFGGGKWDVATTANNYIQKTLNAVARRIEKSTLGAVKMKDLMLVVSPTIAMQMAEAQEIRETLIQSQWAMPLIAGEAPVNQQYGLPNTLYGMKLRVDPTIEVSTQMNVTGTATADYLSSATTAYVVSRPGDLVNNAGIATDFASVHCFVYKDEEMLAEVLDDPFNKKKIAALTDNFVMKEVATEATVRITACVD